MALMLKGARVIDPQVSLDEVQDVLIVDGKIAAVGCDLDVPEGCEVKDCSGLELIPGMLDMHTHFRDPGQEYKENIATGSRAAAKGGFTAVATMGNTDPVCDNGTVVRYQIDRANVAGLCRLYPVGALTRGQKGEALAEIGDMVAEGAVAFSDDGHGVQSAGMMRTCMDYVNQFDKVVLAHCEDESLAGNGVVNEGVVSTRLGLFGQPALSEESEIARDIELSRLTGCPIHFCHISTKRGLELIRAAKAEGLAVTCEVTPHHLFLTEDDIDDTYNTNFKMNPPLRTKADAEALIEGVIDGTIDCIVTDHAPHADHEKAWEFEIAPFGIVGLETSLPLMLTNLVATGKLSMSRLVEVMSVNPRSILRVPAVKIAEGFDADLTLVDPKATFTVTEDFIESKSKNSAFLGQELTGRAVDVFLGGKQTLVDGNIA